MSIIERYIATKRARMQQYTRYMWQYRWHAEMRESFRRLAKMERAAMREAMNEL